MGVAGAAAGAAKSLEEILAAQMFKAKLAEQQRMDAARLRMDQIRLSASLTDAEETRQYRQGQLDRSDADAIAQDTAPGPISGDIASALRKSPVTAARVSTRKILEGVRPVAGSMGAMDESGPQQYDVLEPTQAQGQAQYKKTRLTEISKILSGATNEQQRRAVGAQALGDGIDVPNNLLGQTDAEKEAQRRAEERRDGAEWERRNGITNAQANARQAASDRLMRGRADEARDEKPPTSAQSTLASYAARVEQSEPTLSGLEQSIAKMSAPSFEAQMWADKPYLQSAEMQQYSQASKNYINAVLRRESGAVISPNEFANARAQYLPVPGDTPETLALKRQNRALNAATFKRGAGKAYQSVDDALKGAAGEVGGEQQADTPLSEIRYERDPKTGRLIRVGG